MTLDSSLDNNASSDVAVARIPIFYTEKLPFSFTNSLHAIKQKIKSVEMINFRRKLHARSEPLLHRKRDNCTRDQLLTKSSYRTISIPTHFLKQAIAALDA
jgi:hypothetical protein